MESAKRGFALVLGAVIAFVGIEAYNWYNPSKLLVGLQVKPTPYVADDSKLQRGIDRMVLPLPQGIEALDIKPKQKKKVEKKIGGKLPEGKAILGIKKIGQLPYGANAVIYLEEIPGGPARAEIKVYPNKPPFFEWNLSRSIGAYVGYCAGEVAGQCYNLEFRQELFRLGRIEVEARAGVLSAPLFGTDGYVLVGGKVRF